MKILITGSAGFIGSALSLHFLQKGNEVHGIDNHNDYYDPLLKKSRVERLNQYSKYKHHKIDLNENESLIKIFEDFKTNKVINLAAQAGVRYSIENPHAYVNSNIVGFLNILENCRNFKINHLLYASTSSVYGLSTKIPFSEYDEASHPLSLYAASKRANELMAHSYSNLYNLPTTGLRFFTVYGPWGRPDMALFKFTKSILNDEFIYVFNNGDHTRDFTYIDDIVSGISKAVDKIPQENLKWDSNNPDLSSSKAPWEIYNIGNNKPVKLLSYIEALEKSLGKKAKIKFLPLQPGDVKNTNADINKISKSLNYKPRTSISDGVDKFVNWYKEFYNK